MGGPGDDHLSTEDAKGNDSIDGGPDSDTCRADPHDAVANCEQ